MPVLARELSSLGSRHGLYIARLLLLFIFSLVLGLTLVVALGTHEGRGFNYRDLALMGRAFFIALFVTELVLVWVITSGISGGVIAAEREHRTLDLLLITPLGAGRVLFQKFLSRIVVLLFIVGYSIPFLLAGLALGGVGAREVWRAYYHIAGHGVLACGLGFFCSATQRKAHNAGAAPVGILLLLAILMPLAELVLGMGMRGPTLTFVLHPFWASCAIVCGDWTFGEWHTFLPAAWAAIGVLLAFLAGRIVMVRSYVEPVVLVAGPAKKARKWTDVVIAVLGGIFLLAMLLLAVWISFFPSRMSWGHNYTEQWPLFTLAVWLLFLFMMVRRLWLGLAPGGKRPPNAALSDEGDPMVWKERNFVSFPQGWRADFVVLVCLLIGMAVAAETSPSGAAAFAVYGVGCAIIPGLLFVVGTFAVSFARERERKTLDMLLISTASRARIVDSSWAAPFRMLWPLGAVLVVGLATSLSSRNSEVSAVQTLLAVAVLLVGIASHGYFALWLSTCMKKATTATFLAVAIPFVLYAIVPFMESVVTLFRGNNVPATIGLDPIVLAFMLAAAHDAPTFAGGMPAIGMAVFYLLVAVWLTFYLRSAAIKRLDRPSS